MNDRIKKSAEAPPPATSAASEPPAPVAEPPAPSTTLKTLEPSEPIQSPKLAPGITLPNDDDEEVTKESRKVPKFPFLSGL
jgi:hypothetical protein